MKCDRCNKETNTTIVEQFDYKYICMNCYDELIALRDMKTIEQLTDDKILHTLNAEQIVKNFVSCFAEYQKHPSAQLLDILWRIRCWACHEDHTAATTIFEILKWQKFNFDEERNKYRGESHE